MLCCIQRGRTNTSYQLGLHRSTGEQILKKIFLCNIENFAYVKIPTTLFHCAHRSLWPLFNIIHVNMHKLSNMEDFHTNNKNWKIISAKSTDLKK